MSEPSRVGIRAAALAMTPEEYTQRLYEDYVFFIREIYHDRGLDKFHPISDVEADAARFLAEPPSMGGSRRRVVLMWRGAGKTHWGTSGVACWRLFRDPTCYIDVVSKSDSKAKEIINLIKGWLESVWFLKHLAPNASCRSSTTYFDTPQYGGKGMTYSVFSVGVTGQLEGRRAHIVLCDDVETDQNTLTAEARSFLFNRTGEFEAVSSYGEREVVYVGTYHHIESLYKELEKIGYDVRTWPLEYPALDEKVLNLAPMLQERLDTGIAGRRDEFKVSLVVPSRYSDEFVLEKRARPGFYAMQYMLLSEHGGDLIYPLKLGNLIVPSFALDRDKAPISIGWGTVTANGIKTSSEHEDVPFYGFTGDCLRREIKFDSQQAAYTHTIMWIDPAGGGSDETTYCIAGHLNGYIWVKALGGWREALTDEHLDLIACLAKNHNARQIFVEDAGGYGSIALALSPIVRGHSVEAGGEQEFASGWSCSVEREPGWSKGQKEERIIGALEPVFATHRLVVSKDVAADATLQKQIAYITRQRGALEHDDRVEALAAVVWKLGDMLRIDPEQAAESMEDRIAREVVRDWMARTHQQVREEYAGWLTHRK
jgi:plasmid stabilization system protein ParE